MAYSLGKLSWQGSFQDSFLDKLKRRPEFENRLRQELLPSYYRGIGSLAANLYDPSLEEWPVFFIQALTGLDAQWQEAILWGAGFEATLLFEDPYELERMVRATPSKFREAFERGISDRFEGGWEKSVL